MAGKGEYGVGLFVYVVWMGILTEAIANVHEAKKVDERPECRAWYAAKSAKDLPRQGGRVSTRWILEDSCMHVCAKKPQECAR
jgi:hypothetical protein